MLTRKELSMDARLGGDDDDTPLLEKLEDSSAAPMDIIVSNIRQKD